MKCKRFGLGRRGATALMKGVMLKRLWLSAWCALRATAAFHERGGPARQKPLPFITCSEK